MTFYYSMTEAWLAELREAREEGERVSPRGMLTWERPFVQFTVANPLTFPLAVSGREFRDAIGVLEGLSMVGEFSVPELFTDRVRNFANFTDGGIFWGSYGARVHGQVGDLVARIAGDPDTRQAVLTMFDGHRDLAATKRDIPCTLSVQFLLRGRLHMRVTMRSNDLWLGLPYDMVQFAILQTSLAQALGTLPGEYAHAAGSLHLYERDAKLAEVVSFKGHPEMEFPLWSPELVAEYPTPQEKMGAIGRRARRLALGKLDPQTTFERWAVACLQS